LLTLRTGEGKPGAGVETIHAFADDLDNAVNDEIGSIYENQSDDNIDKNFLGLSYPFFGPP
jgi:hypothetical protein